MTTHKAAVSKPRSASARLRKQANVVGEDIQGMGTIARDAAQETFEQMQDDASELYDQGRDTARRAARSLEQYIAEQPLTSMLIAGGVGLLLGRFWKHR